MSQNLLSNPNFTDAGPDGLTIEFTGIGTSGLYVAANWSLFHNNQGTSETELLTNGPPIITPGLIRVSTTASRNGLVNVFLPIDPEPQATVAKVQVYVVRGVVGIGTGNGGDTSFDAFSKSTGSWELIQAGNGGSPANEFIIYAASDDGAVFYVHSAEVVEA